MKQLRKLTLAATLVAATPLVAQAGAAPPAPDPLALAFGAAEVAGIDRLTSAEMEDTTGSWLPAFVFGVVTVDLALSAYFWGVYVPTYGAGACNSCMSHYSLY